MLGRTMRIAGLLLLLLPVAAQAETRLESLVWEDGVLILGFDGPYESRGMVLDDPHRIVMDFPEVHSDLQRHVYAGGGALESIRVGQNAADEPGGLRVRVVLDLASSHNFLSEQAGNYLRIVLSPGSGEDLGTQTAAGARAPGEAAALAAAEPAVHVAPSTVTDEDPYELPMFAESNSLPAPPPVEAVPEQTEPAASPPPLMSAGMGAMDPMAAPTVGAEPTKKTELPTPDLAREDPAPVGWEDSVNAEFSRLFEGQTDTVEAAPTMLPMAGPIDDMGMGSTATDAVPELVESYTESVPEPEPSPEPILEPIPEPNPEAAVTASEAVFFGDPFDVAEEMTTDESSSSAEVDVPMPDQGEHNDEIKASPVGKPVILSADMGAAQDQDWEVSVSAPPESDTTSGRNEINTTAAAVIEPDAAPVSAPVVKFSRGQSTADVNASRGQAIMQVASAEVPRKKARSAEGSDREEAMRLAMMAGHERVKPDEANISLEMRGAEFKTLLRAFSEFAGINIIAGRDVTGKVSVNLQEVPWREALAAVCSAHGYSVKEEHGLLRIAPLSSLLKEELELLTAQKKRREYRNLHTEVVKLSYAVAGEIVAPLSNMLGERGKMDIDSRTNSLLITDLPEAVAHMVALAKILDHQIPQVEITARIVDVDYAASRELGIKWEALNLVNSSAGLVGTGGIDGTFPAPVGEFKMAKVHDWGEINVTLQAMEKENKANIISNPRVMTMDNREASILVGKKIPLIVADEAGNAVTQLTTIGIKLVVTPHINPDGRIVMDVHTEVSDLASEATVQGGVIITTSESKTNVMVDNGETAVIAGLLKASDSTLDTEVPFFGRIPILGKLFGYNNKSESKRELVIFITPRVITAGSETTASDLSEQGYTIPSDG